MFSKHPISKQSHHLRFYIFKPVKISFPLVLDNTKKATLTDFPHDDSQGRIIRKESESSGPGYQNGPFI